MSFSMELRSNVIVFRIKDAKDDSMITGLAQDKQTIKSPDNLSAVTIYNNDEDAKKAFRKMKAVVDSFKKA